jgi:hypothetical protein
MKTLKKLWIELVLALIGPALDERDRRAEELEEQRRALVEQHYREFIAPRRLVEQKAAHEEMVADRKAFEARLEARKAARAEMSASEADRFYRCFPVSPLSHTDTCPMNSSK